MSLKLLPKAKQDKSIEISSNTWGSGGTSHLVATPDAEGGGVSYVLIKLKSSWVFTIGISCLGEESEIVEYGLYAFHVILFIP